jgi:nucleotide-binding universal stress UspA family protein
MFTTILVASDGSETADRVVTVAQSLAKEGQSKVVVAHVTVDDRQGREVDRNDGA